MKTSLITAASPGWVKELESLVEGSHVALVAEDGPTAGLEARSAGLEFRDTLLVLEPGITASVVLLLRKPIAEATVAEQMLRTGTGGLNIEVCRSPTNDDLSGGAYSKNGDDRET